MYTYITYVNDKTKSISLPHSQSTVGIYMHVNNSPLSLLEGGLTRGSTWKGRENKDRWLPGWAQSSKEGGEGEGKGAGPNEQPEDKDKVGEPSVQH